MTSLLAKSAVEVVLNHETPGFYARLFVIPKRTGGWRPVLDLSPLNRFLRPVPFRMETPHSVRMSLRPGDWVASIDLSDAYFHLLIHPSHRKWMRFAWRGRVYQFRALPFGLSQAPWIFTKAVLPLASTLRSRGIRLSVYLDDWLIKAQSCSQCRTDLDLTLSLTRECGFAINVAKCDLVPSQRFLFLGMLFDTVAWSVRPSDERIDRLAALIQSLSVQRLASARTLASLVGAIASMALLVPLGAARARPIQRWLSSAWTQHLSTWESLIAIDQNLLSALQPWSNRSLLTKGVPITPPPPAVEVFTDASNLGWGGVCGQLHAQGVWSRVDAHLHINVLELEAVTRSLLAFLPRWSPSHILVRSDNSTVVSYINRQGGTRSRLLSLRAEALLFRLEALGFSLSAVHISGRLNVLADTLSRSAGVIGTEWTIVHRALQPVWDLWGKPMIDLFATRFNSRLPIFVSPVPDDRALHVDALDMSWTGLLAYAFPPFALLQRVIRKAELERPSLILVAPYWPSQVWFPDLLRLSKGRHLDLRLKARSLLQPRSGVPHPDPESLHLHVWRLSPGL